MATNLVFLCGFPSSGTDLLKNVLNAHPDVFIGGEFPLLPTLCRRYGPVIPGGAVDGLVEDLKSIDVYRNFRNPAAPLPPRARGFSVAEIYSRMLYAGERKWKGNKTPQNTENIDKLKMLFPDAKFIVIIRDIRDVALSWKNKWGKDQLLCASKWDSRMRRGYELTQKFQKDCLIVKYEALLDDFEPTARQICAFLGIEMHENMFRFDRHVKEIVEGKLNYGRPILSGNHGKWRREMGRSRTKRIEEIAWKGLKLFGYRVQEAGDLRPLTAMEKYLGLARDVYALLFVGNRAIQGNTFGYRINAILYEFRKRLSFRYGAR